MGLQARAQFVLSHARDKHTRNSLLVISLKTESTLAIQVWTVWSSVSHSSRTKKKTTAESYLQVPAKNNDKCCDSVETNSTDGKADMEDSSSNQSRGDQH